MPEICRFLGIIIRMYYREHYPSHFHAEYNEYEITVNIEDGVIEGKFPKRALKVVMEWYELNKEDLKENWERVLKKEELKKLKPLE